MKTKTITLPVEVWEKISDALALYEDRGPAPEGRKSLELERAEILLESALAEAEEIEKP